MTQRAPAAGALLVFVIGTMCSTGARADCKSPLPTEALRALDERVDADPAAVIAEAERRLRALDPAAAQQAAELQAIRADAYSLLDDDDSVRPAVDAGRAQLRRLPDGAARRLLEVRFRIVAADSMQGPAELANAVEDLTQLETALPVDSLDRACALIVRSRQFMRLGREEAATADGIRGYQLASAIRAPAAVADAAYQLAATYMRAGLWRDGVARADEAATYDRATGRAARLSNDLYVKSSLLYRQGRHAASLAAIDEALAINVRLHQHIDVAFDLLQRCRALVELQRMDEAERSCRESSAGMTQAGRLDQTAVVEGELARIELLRGRAAAAVTRLDRVLSVNEDRLPPRALPTLYRYRADALAKIGRYEAAWRDLERVERLEDQRQPGQQSLAAAEIKERLNTELMRHEKSLVERQLQRERQHALDLAGLYRLRLALAIAGGLLLLALALLMWIRARHDRAVRRSMQQLETQARVLSTMREGVALLDAGGRVQYANPSLLGMLGRPAGEVLSRPLADLGIDLAGSAEAAADAATPAAPVECHVHDAAGRRLILLLTWSRLQLADRSLRICILQDVTDLRRLEQQMHSANSAELGKLGSAVHEGIAQDLTGISLLLRTVAGKSADDAAQLDLISTHVSRVIAHARTLARGLSPVQAAGGSLSAALAHCAQELVAKQGVDIVVNAQLESVAAGLAQADQLYRLASEALRWAAGAEGCSRIELDLHPAGGNLQLRLRGDGTESLAAVNGQAQTELIAYLARLLGGRVEIIAAPGAPRSLKFSVALEALAVGAGQQTLSRASSGRAEAHISPTQPPS